MKIRTGRRNKRNLYLQLGDAPDNADPCIGFMLDGEDADLVAEGLTSPWHLNELKISAALRDDPRDHALSELAPRALWDGEGTTVQVPPPAHLVQACDPGSGQHVTPHRDCPLR